MDPWHGFRAMAPVALGVAKPRLKWAGGFCVYPGVRDLAVAYFYLDTRAHGGANGD